MLPWQTGTPSARGSSTDTDHCDFEKTVLEQGLQTGPAVPSCLRHRKGNCASCLPSCCRSGASREQRHSLVLIRSRCFVAETGSSVLGAGLMWQVGGVPELHLLLSAGRNIPLLLELAPTSTEGSKS